jgi:hypothetical protein
MRLYWVKGEDYNKTTANVAVLIERYTSRFTWQKPCRKNLSVIKMLSMLREEGLPDTYRFPESQHFEVSIENFIKFGKDAIYIRYWPIIGPLLDGTNGTIAFLCSRDSRHVLSAKKLYSHIKWELSERYKRYRLLGKCLMIMGVCFVLSLPVMMFFKIELERLALFGAIEFLYGFFLYMWASTHLND